MGQEAFHRMSDLFHVMPLSFIRTMHEHGEDIRDMIETLGAVTLDGSGGARDWQGERYRVIHEEDATDILADELESDPYVLGCFNADFLESVTGVPAVIIKAAQDGGQYEAIGKWLIDAGHVQDSSGPAHYGGIAANYAKADGFGHHFAVYDGETDTQAGGWLVFKTN